MTSVQLTRSRVVGKWTRPRTWSSLRWGFWSLVTRPVVYTWSHRQRWGICLISLVKGGTRHYQWDNVRDVGDLSMITRRFKPEPGEPQDHIAPLESKILAKQLGLVHHMAATRYTDGTARVPGTVSITTQGVSWVVTINDVDSCARLRVLAATLDAALLHAATLISEPEAPWEPAPWLEREVKGKKRK